MTETAARILLIRSLLPSLESALKSFSSSAAKFKVVRTVNPPPAQQAQPKTLFILDSSFNPPTSAHLTLATSALRSVPNRESPPYRLLLLFSTHNADKAPNPAVFVQRLPLMTIFAEDLADHLSSPKGAEASGGRLESKDPAAHVPIDIGLTTEPYYTDKSAAIQDAQPPIYSGDPTHVHLIGYDTLVRFLAPKYYPGFSPPLSALAPFFAAGHRLLVTERPSETSDGSSSSYGTLEEQRDFVNGLAEGNLQEDGFQKEWAEQIRLQKAGEGVGVSSTRVRQAAKMQRREDLESLCTPGVAGWVREMKLYDDE